jgi:hypothetical protein
MNFLLLSLSATATFAASVLRRAKFSLIFSSLEDFSASGGRVAFAASAFRLAKTSWALVLSGAPSVVTVALLDLPFLEVSAGSDPMLPGGCIFLPAVGGTGRGE